MTGAEHYRKAEDLAREAGNYPPDSYDRLGAAQLAQVHATLALTAATAAGGLDRIQWNQAIFGDAAGDDLVLAGPLVTPR